MTPFHLAFPVTDLEQTRKFYVDVLGCTIGRHSDQWVDLDFFGHQLTAHLVTAIESDQTNDVDGHVVPARHFGAILEWQKWETLSDKLELAGITFLIAPTIRFKGKQGEQGTFFVRDPSGNALEFKTFKDQQKLFMK